MIIGRIGYHLKEHIKPNNVVNYYSDLDHSIPNITIKRRIYFHLESNINIKFRIQETLNHLTNADSSTIPKGT